MVLASRFLLISFRLAEWLSGMIKFDALSSIQTSTRNKMCDALVDDIDAGTTNPNGKFRVYTAGFASLLAELDFANPAFGNAAAGVATANAIADETSAPATGVAAVCRVVDRDGNTVFEGTVTATGGGGDLELSNVNITTGDVVKISSATMTMPAG